MQTPKVRSCPSCGREILYYGKNSIYKAKKEGRVCQSCASSGENNPMFGKKHTKHSIRLMHNNTLGRPSPCGFEGKVHSDESRLKMSLAGMTTWAKRFGVSVEHMHDMWSEWKKYRTEVRRLTYNQPLHLLENFDKRGRAGVSGAYHLDHIISVFKGFKQSIPPEQIASMNNLKMIPWMDNQQKWWK